MAKKKSKKSTPKTKTKTKSSARKKPAKKPSRNLVKKGRLPAKRKKKGSVSVTPSDPLLQVYMKEVHRHALLSREEEHELAVKYHESGDKEAYQRLVTSNLRFVVKIAYEYIHYRLKLLDLIQEGNMGLVKAVHDFDPYKGVKLTTYAVWWIRSYIQDAILRNYSLVKIGTTQAQKKLFYRLRREQAKLAQQGIGREESMKMLAEKFEVKEKEVRQMDVRMSGGEASLNAPIGDEDNTEHITQLTDDSQEGVVEILGNSEQKLIFLKILKEFANTLEGRDKEIFEKRLIAEKPATLQELGDKYGVSKERARQIEEQIKTRLKTYMQEHYPDYDLQ